MLLILPKTNKNNDNKKQQISNFNQIGYLVFNDPNPYINTVPEVKWYSE